MNAHRFILLLLTLVVIGCSTPSERREAAHSRSQAALARGDVHRAEKVLRSHLAYAPHDASTVQKLAHLLLEDGRPFEAEDILLRLPSDRVPERDESVLHARVALACGRLTEAVPLFLALEREAPLPEEDRESLLRIGACSPGVFPPESPPSWLEEVLRLQISQGCLELAAETLADLPRDAPERPLATDRLARALLLRGERPLPRRLEALLEANPETPWALLARHALLIDQGSSSEAADVERTFLARFPDHPQRARLLIQMARRSLRAGRAEEALERSSEAAFLSPDHSEPLIEQALAFTALGRQADARRSLAMALALDPASTAARELQESVERRRRASGVEGRLQFSFTPEEDPGG